jgi:ATP-dependent exoDNAse (exonuclease V) alpha subunit
MNLSKEQKNHLNRILKFKGPGVLFITGSAGTGKSTLIRALQKADKNQITLAPTGIAAIQASGATIHSFFGIKPGSVIAKMRSNSKKALKNANRLIIDEISMVRSDLLQLVNNTMQDELNNADPFGGKPLIIFGDCAQIEAVVKSDEKKFLVDTYGGHFFFDADCIKELNPIEIIQLTTIYRQKEDIEYIEALQALREGRTDKLNVFNDRIDVPHDDAIRITYTNKRSDLINQIKIQEIDSPSYGSNATIEGDFNESEYPTAQRFIFKLGARVMLLRNNYEPKNEYVNGDIGTIINIKKDFLEVLLDRGNRIVTVEKYKWEKIAYTYIPGMGIDSEVVGAFTQLPMKLAWAYSAHKVQGQTFHGKVHVELETKSFAHGLLYVALSRATKLENLTIGRRIKAEDVIIDERVTNWSRENNI